ncbi:MAG: response regulator [Polyangiaceae bacterium]
MERELAQAPSRANVLGREVQLANRVLRKIPGSYEVLSIALTVGEARDGASPGQPVSRASAAVPSAMSASAGSGARELDSADVPPKSLRPTEMASSSPPDRTPAEDRRRPRVLIVHESARMLSTVMTILGKDFDVVTAITGQQALSMVESATFDLVIADQDLSDRSGLAVVKAAMARHPETSAILLTKREHYQDVARAMRAAAIVPRVLVEPLEPAELLSRARSVLTLLRMREATSKLQPRSGPAD